MPKPRKDPSKPPKLSHNERSVSRFCRWVAVAVVDGLLSSAAAREATAAAKAVLSAIREQRAGHELQTLQELVRRSEQAAADRLRGINLDRTSDDPGLYGSYTLNRDALETADGRHSKR